MNTPEAIDGGEILPGYTLSKLGPVEIGELEKHFKTQHLSEAVAAAKTPEAMQVMAATAMQNNAKGTWRRGSLGFAWAASEPANLPKLLHLALRRCHPQISEPEAAALISAENEPIIHTALLRLCGLDLPEV